MIQSQATATMKNLYIGVMSGTSVDAIDIVAVEIFDDSFNFINADSFEFEESLRKDILEISRSNSRLNKSAVKLVDQKLADTYGKAINEFISRSKINKSDIEAVGLHGQTILHKPNAENPFSLQVGDGQIVSNITGLTVIDDFRSADINAGGQGAPLAPLFHAFFFGQDNEVRVVVNIGGISNESTFEGRKIISGYDYGPGNVLLDAWAKYNGIGDYDEDGEWAKTGTVNKKFLSLLLNDEFMFIHPPKSTGTDYFNLDWIFQKIGEFNKKLRPEDIQRTFLELTTGFFVCFRDETLDFRLNKIAISGGGSKNKFLMSEIADALLIADDDLLTTADWGLDPQWVEAAGFAYLACLRVNEISVNLSKVTGSKGKIMLGNIKRPD